MRRNVYVVHLSLVTSSIKFLDPHEVQTFRTQLEKAVQGDNDFNEYTTYYENLVLKAQYKIDERITHFLGTLHPVILSNWKSPSVPSSFSEVCTSIRQSISFTQIINQAKITPKGKTSNFIPSTFSGNKPVYKGESKSSNNQKELTSVWKDGNKPGPFTFHSDKPGYEIRLAAGRCTRCSMKHSTSLCPHYPTSKSNVENYQHWKRLEEKHRKEMGQTNDRPSSNINAVDTNIPIAEEVVYEMQNTDDDSDAYLAWLNRLQTEELSVGASPFLINFTLQVASSKALQPPLVVTLADGATQQTLRKRIESSTLTIFKHDEVINFPIFHTQRYDMILGLDWLTYHNPTIDWELRNIIFDGYICKHPSSPHQVPPDDHVAHVRFIIDEGEHIGKCINTAPIQSNSIQKTSVMAAPEGQEVIPPKSWPMSEFPRIFDMKKQGHLSPHRDQWDYDVTFKDSATLPKNRPMFRLSEKHKKLVDKYIDSELASGKIRVSKSPIVANLFFVPKSDSTELRPCIDYRDLNAYTIDDKYPVPPVHDLIRDLSGGEWYSELDFRWASNNLRIKEGSEWKFAFKCHRGQYEPLVMPFGPKQCPSHMQRFVRENMQDFIKEGWLVNILDDFGIKTRGTIQHHTECIRRYLQRIDELGLYVKKSKCKFFQKEIPFVGFIVSKDGYRKQPEKLEAILRWGRPNDPKDVRKFMGYLNFCRPFAKDLSVIAQPLYDLTVKGRVFQWKPSHQQAFDAIKKILIEDVTLSFPNFEKPFYLHFDSSSLATGAVLHDAT
ncbi:hypothetical protein SeLEV6574_g00642 [Synchytrium endobioticum]|uniref:Reverse transcriptase domain-containing protein n=1 Tax=Synchytrium endobioticum TaxID=286115 RepID=A0A507DGM7_9FUNG|nr:hypothetical protein SeLEV6574_g00642 [Synchytrium endobioticum]